MIQDKPKKRPTMPELLGLPFVCLACGGQLRVAASQRTIKHRSTWLCVCVPAPAESPK